MLYRCGFNGLALLLMMVLGILFRLCNEMEMIEDRGTIERERVERQDEGVCLLMELLLFKKN